MAAQNQLPFVVIATGLPPLNFEMMNSGTETFIVADLPNPGVHPLLTFSLSQEIPADKSLCLYYSVPPYDNLSFITAVANPRPSDIINTGFQLNPDINMKQSIKLVVKPEDISKADDLLKTARPDFQKQYAVKVAENLYNFISSYDTQTFTVNGKQQEYNMVPKDVFERWMGAFEKKFNLDRNFLLK